MGAEGNAGEVCEDIEGKEKEIVIKGRRAERVGTNG
jgi:hypothetical protein